MQQGILALTEADAEAPEFTLKNDTLRRLQQCTESNYTLRTEISG